LRGFVVLGPRAAALNPGETAADKEWVIQQESAHFIHYRQRPSTAYSGYPWHLESVPVELIYGSTGDLLGSWGSLVLGQSVRDDIAGGRMEQIPLKLGRDDHGRFWWGFEEQFYSTAEANLEPDEVRAMVEESVDRTPSESSGRVEMAPIHSARSG
jgi:hypothetical protein